MFSLGDQGEPSSNKQTAVDANKASNVFFPTVKAVYDWAVGLFVTGAASSTDNAIARFDGTTGKLVQNSSVTITDSGNIGIGTTAPSYPLHIFRSGINSTLAIQTTLTPGTPHEAQFDLKSGDNYTRFFSRDSDYTFGIYHVINGVGLTKFRLDGNGNMRLMETGGYVGIKTIAPTDTLDVNGTSRFRDAAKFNGQILDNVGSSGVDGQVLKKVGGQVVWSNP